MVPTRIFFNKIIVLLRVALRFDNGKSLKMPFILVCALATRYCFIGRLLFSVTYGADILRSDQGSRAFANQFVEPM